jgi:hypothetical protein
MSPRCLQATNSHRYVHSDFQSLESRSADNSCQPLAAPSLCFRSRLSSHPKSSAQTSISRRPLRQLSPESRHLKALSDALPSHPDRPQYGSEPRLELHCVSLPRDLGLGNSVFFSLARISGSCTCMREGDLCAKKVSASNSAQSPVTDPGRSRRQLSSGGHVHEFVAETFPILVALRRTPAPSSLLAARSFRTFLPPICCIPRTRAHERQPHQLFPRKVRRPSAA